MGVDFGVPELPRNGTNPHEYCTCTVSEMSYFGHIAEDPKVAELKGELERRDERIKELTEERD
jgi:hypothetical protein